MDLARLELWALRCAAVGAVLWFVGWSIYAKGEAHIQAKWDTQEQERKIAEGVQSAKNKLESANRQADVLVAEAAAKKATLDLAAYRSAYSLHGLVSRGVHTQTACHPAESGGGTSHIETTTTPEAAGLLQPQGSGDIGDQLDELFAEADRENEDYRVCLSTRPAPSHSTVPGAP